MSAEGQVSARDAVKSAFAELEGISDTTVAPSTADTPQVEAVTPVEGVQAAPVEIGKTAAERARDESGKFVKADTKPEPVAVEAKAPVIPDLTIQKLTAPPNWKGGGKIKWDKLPRDIQQELTDDYRSRGDLQSKFDPIDRILAPRRDALIAMYGSEAQALQQLFALSDFASKDRLGFIKFFAQQSGIDVSTLTGRPQAAQVDGTGNDQLPDDPRLQAMMSKLTGLEQKYTQLTQSQQTQAQQEAQSTLDAFFSDSRYPYAQDVRHKIGVLLGNGAAKDLPDAYEQAIWMDPNIRQRLLDEKIQAQHAQRVEIAQTAKNHAVSVSGAPGGIGGVPKPLIGVPPGETPRATIKRLLDEATARA